MNNALNSIGWNFEELFVGLPHLITHDNGGSRLLDNLYGKYESMYNLMNPSVQIFGAILGLGNNNT